MAWRSTRTGFGRPARGRAARGRAGRRDRPTDADLTELLMPALAAQSRGRRAPVGRAARAALRAYVQWVMRAPDTRGLGTGLAALYPAGHLAHLYATDPQDALLLGAFAPPAALVTWVATHKAHGSARYSAALTATAAGIPVWLATAAHTGITNLPTLLGYTLAATTTWSAYTWSDVLRERRRHAALQASWDTIASLAGLDGTRLLRAEPTHTGTRFKVDLGADGPSVSRLERGELAEQIARSYGIGADQVRVNGDAKNARILWITVQLRDPWATPVPHPALTTTTGHQAPDAEDVGVPTAPVPQKASRSILDGPFVLGTAPETGEDLVLSLFDEGGARHVDIFAGTGGGKSTLLSNIVEQADECDDVLTLAIDLGKGTIPHLWREVLDDCAGIGEQDKALRILTWIDTIIAERSRKTGGANHKPTPTAPAIILIIDEQDTLTGIDSPIAHRAKPIINNVHRRGRSAGISLVRAGQRNVVQHTGSKEGDANASTKIVLRVKTTKEMTKAIEEWQILGLPDMSTYAPGVKGVTLIVDEGGTWQLGRTRDLSDFNAVRALSAARGRPTATLERDIAATLPGYAERHPATASTAAGATGRTSHAPDAGTPTATGQGPAVTPPAHHAATRTGTADGDGEDGDSHDSGEGTGGGGGEGWGIDLSDDAAIAHASEGMTAEIERHLRNMPPPPAQPTRLDDLMEAKRVFDAAETNPPGVNRRVPVPDDIAHSVIHLLTTRGADGARRDEIVAVLGKPEGSVKRWLAIMRDHQMVMLRGNGKAARYYLPDHAPSDHDQ